MLQNMNPTVYVYTTKSKIVADHTSIDCQSIIICNYSSRAYREIDFIMKIHINHSLFFPPSYLSPSSFSACPTSHSLDLFLTCGSFHSAFMIYSIYYVIRNPHSKYGENVNFIFLILASSY